MPNIILGLAGAIGHDPAAALYIDGELVAACEDAADVARRLNREVTAKPRGRPKKKGPEKGV